MITVSKFNESYIHVDSDDRGILQELADHMTFDVPGAKFTPKFKMKIWDGKIRLFSLQNRCLYAGLYQKLQEWAKNCNYAVQVVDSKQYKTPDFKNDVTPESVHKFVDALDIHSKGVKLQIRDYQYASIYTSLKDRRATILSPTGSGKSLIQYCVLRYILDQEMNCMVVVPTTALVLQMLNDFKDYSSVNGWDVDTNSHIIMAGREKLSNKPLYITTWQSVYKQHKDYFNRFDCICVDEVHLAKASSLTGIMEKATEVPYRFGFTGSLDNSKTNQLVIQGLFGKVTKVTSTKQLMDEGHLADMTIKCVVLKYNDDSKKLVKSMDYQREIDFLVSHDKRNKFIRNLALSLKGNTLILFTLVEKHGKELNKLLSDKTENRLHYIHGGVEAEARDEVRNIVENSNNAIILASVGVFSTGVNIKRLHNIIFASPTKSVIRVLQSLGRGLRKAHDKNEVTVYDISDNIVNLKSKRNFTYIHFIERLRIYASEDFNYTITEVPIER